MCGRDTCLHICLSSSSVGVQVCGPSCVLLRVCAPSGGGRYDRWSRAASMLTVASLTRVISRCLTRGRLHNCDQSVKRSLGMRNRGLNHTSDQSLAPLLLRCPLTSHNANVQRRKQTWPREVFFVKAKDKEKVLKGFIVLSLLYRLKHQRFRVLEAV